MKDEIRLLPDSVANQIAAGEVIQRPASVLKELVENAVDAGADDIKIIIRDAGRTLIQVIDNGKGMSETDVRMAFERHATSKISSASDLFSLSTMGFRGEALPSICAVSMVEVRTRREDMTIGTRLVINGSKVETQQQEVCERGTNIMVKNLFFNVPARRKFLKSDNVELANIMKEFERLALVNNHIRLSIDTGVRSLDLKKASFRQRIADLWQGNMAQQLIPVEVDTSIVKIKGLVSRPEQARRRNALQFFIVNGRNMKHPYFHRAVVNCYTSLIAADTMPNYFIKFEVDPASIDVNIHPTKNEIKFEDEPQIWSILTAAVKATLGKNAAVPSINFDTDVLSVAPVSPADTLTPPEITIPTDYNPFSPSGPGAGRKSSPGASPSGWESLYDNFMKGPGKKGGSPLPEQSATDKRLSIAELSSGKHDNPSLFNNVDFPSVLCLQYLDKYILTVMSEGVIVIDQHRAHVKILYRQFMQQAASGGAVSQSVLFPETIEISAEQQVLFDEVEGVLNSLGFRFEKEKEGVWLIAGVPADCPDIDAKDLVYRIMDSVGEENVNYGNEKADEIAFSIRSSAALLMARSAAIMRGRKLSPEEMEKIVGELFRLPDPSFTPSGRRIFAVLGEDDISRLLP